MKMRMIVRSIAIFFCFFAVLQQSILIAGLLPLYLPSDKAWAEDAKQANANVNHFAEPLDTVSYADYRYVGTHNSFTYPRFFRLAYQQDQTILGHLSYGVRGLMLDTYDWSLNWPFFLVGPNGAKVCLSHGAPGDIALLQKGTNAYQSLKYELRRVVEFLRVNPRAVVTIILEDYALRSVTVKEIKEVMVEAGYDPLFKPLDFVENQWPTLGWMRAHNKRLVIFTQRAPSSDMTFSQFTYMVENQYDTINEDALCVPRQESHGSGLLVAFNNFKSLGITPPTLFTRCQVQYDTAKRVTTNCQAKHFANGRLFNSYWADRVIASCNSLYESNQKTIFEYVNELNANPNKTMS